MKLTCPICPRHCRLNEGQTGFCRARKNENDKIISLNYGKLTSIALDPIEKKPLMRFHPGGCILSVGSFGCSLSCPFCQNSDISMAGAEAQTLFVSPKELADKATELAHSPRGNLGVAYTYNEPLISYEYLIDCSRLIHERGLFNVLVTNGCICPEPLNELLPYIDAMNIDLKGFSSSFYEWVKGDFETVKNTITAAAKKCHVEVTTLIIPGRNDSEDEMQAEAEWLASVSTEIPLHISRFFPRYKASDIPPTPIETIRRLCLTAKKHLKYVYSGNC